MRQSHNDVVCLAILEKLEAFREKLDSGEINEGTCDWAIRMCESYVADYSQYKNRASWVQVLREQ